MTIAFIHDHNAFLPEIDAYCNFFSALGIECKVIDKSAWKHTERDVDWVFMGTDFRRHTPAIRIHEYASASTPPLHRIKDRLKQILTATPDFRIYQNKYVARQIRFCDGVPMGYRDMGVDRFVPSPNDHPQKDIDFISIGRIHSKKEYRKTIEHFSLRFPDKMLLTVSRDHEDLKRAFSDRPNIVFKGPLNRNEVHRLLLRSSFALNCIPGKAPYNRQTSTRFLEYLNHRVPVLTTDYEWVRNFERENGGRYFYLNPDWGNADWEALQQFPFQFPDMKNWTWERQILKSGVLDFLKSRFPDLSLSVTVE